MKTIILASASERRIEMFRKHGFNPIVMPAHIDEKIPENDESGNPITPECAAACLAEQKASHILKQLAMQKKGENTALSETAPSETVIFGFDTIVVFAGEIIGKPKDPEEAFEVLSKLSGKCHEVITGVCVFNLSGGADGTPTHCTFSDTTKVWFRDIPQDELRAYVETDEPYDKAGGYAIQGTFAKYVDHIEGDKNTVIGLPWARIEKYL